MNNQICGRYLAPIISFSTLLLSAEAVPISQLTVNDPAATSLLWDANSPNWYNGSTPVAFKNGDAVLFNSTSTTPVNVQVSSGLTTSQLSLGSGDYIFSGNILTVSSNGYDATGLSNPSSIYVLANYSGTTTFNNGLQINGGISLQGYASGTLNLKTYSGGRITTDYNGIGSSANSFKIKGSNVAIFGSSGIYNGGGLMITDGASINLSNSFFRYITATNDGGTAYISHATASFGNTLIEGNAAAHGGGAIYNTNSSTLTIDNSRVSRNSAAYGAALVNDASTATITNSIFNENTASDYAAVLNDNGATLTIFGDSQIGYNRSNDYAGAILNRAGSTLNIDGTFFDNNSSAKFAGAVLNTSSASKALIKNATFTNNTAATYGGGLCNGEQAEAIITDSVFRDNSAAGGGAVYNRTGGTLTINNVLFDSNQTWPSTAGMGNGGALGQTDAGSTLTVSNSVFTGNHAASQGGALYTGESATLNNVTMTGNSADDKGGAIYVNTGLTATDKTLTLHADAGKTSTISGNYANRGATGIAFDRMATNGDLTHSLGNAALVLSGAGTINLYDSISADLNNGKRFSLTKIGSGELNWGGDHFVDAAGGSTITLSGGQTNLLEYFSIAKGSANDSASVRDFIVNNDAILNVACDAFLGGFTLKIQDQAHLNVIISQLMVDNLNADAGSTLRFGVADSGYGTIVLTNGEFHFDSATILQLDCSNLTFGADRYDFITGITSDIQPGSTMTYNGAAIGNGDIVTLGGRDYSFQLGDTLSLVAVPAAVPEPATCALLAAGSALLGAICLRRKNHK